MKEIRFKRLALKAMFLHAGSKFRKVKPLGAYHINSDGKGQTNAVVPFKRNTFVNPITQ